MQDRILEDILSNFLGINYSKPFLGMKATPKVKN
jgi:hypothetical protein